MIKKTKMKDKAKELFKKKYEKLLKDYPDEGYLPYKDVVKTNEYRLIIELMVEFSAQNK